MLVYARIVAVSDSRGGICNEDGLDPFAVQRHKDETGSVVGFPDSTAISNPELLAYDCDILIPAALECQLHADNADDVSTKLIVEDANGPLTAIADGILQRKGVVVLPDIVANSGGVIVSYFEWVQNRQGFTWIDSVLHKRLQRFMTEAWDEVCEFQLRYGVRMRMAANMLAVERVARADSARGIYA